MDGNKKIDMIHLNLDHWKKINITNNKVCLPK